VFPYLFEFRGLRIQSYGFFISLGYICALSSTIILGKRRNIPTDKSIDLVFIALLIGLVGARILFVLTNLHFYQGNLLEMFAFWNGGFVFYGGLLLVLPFVAFFAKMARLQVGSLYDVLALSLALGHGVGRIGCLAAGCCHGSATNLPWGVVLQSELVEPALRGIPLHPVQLYESGALLITYIVLVRIFLKVTKPPGTIALWYLGAYSGIRFVCEYFRGDSIRGLWFGGMLSTSQIIALVLALASLCFYLFFFRRRARHF
jgi:phosphatidylglycerol:prolipoprotein diacylglycerol transferase